MKPGRGERWVLPAPEKKLPALSRREFCAFQLYSRFRVPELESTLGF